VDTFSASWVKFPFLKSRHCLAIERWYCILRPFKYKQHFTRKRLLLYILAISICSCYLQTTKFFRMEILGRQMLFRKSTIWSTGHPSYDNYLLFVHCLHSMCYYLVYVCPYRTSVQEIPNSKMLRRAAKSSTKSATTHVWGDVSCPYLVLVA